MLEINDIIVINFSSEVVALDMRDVKSRSARSISAMLHMEFSLFISLNNWPSCCCCGGLCIGGVGLEVPAGAAGLAGCAAGKGCGGEGLVGSGGNRMAAMSTGLLLIGRAAAGGCALADAR